MNIFKIDDNDVVSFVDTHEIKQIEIEQDKVRNVMRQVTYGGYYDTFIMDVAYSALAILEGMEDTSDQDNLTEILYEKIDGAVPIYIDDIVKIYNKNYEIVDDACNEYGEPNEQTGESISIARAKIGWYSAISDFIAKYKELN